MQLTGPPRLSGIVRGYASADGPIADEWDDRSTYLLGRRRSRLKGRRQLWPSWSLRLVVTGAEWLAWRSDLRGDAAGEIDWTPRTRAAGDPVWLVEHTYRARVVGGLPTLSELRRQFGDGQHAYVVDVEIEGVQPYAREPDAIDGGYRLVADDGATAVIEPTGQAVYQSERTAVSYRSATGQRGAVLLGPDAVSATRIQPGDVPGTAIIQTIL